MASLVEVMVGGTTAQWESLGFRFVGSSCDLAGIALTVVDGDAGMRGWTIGVDENSPVPTGDVDIDGIRTLVVHASTQRGSRDPSSIGSQRVLGVDHVVVNTDDPDRTCAALGAALGIEVRRTRDAGNGVEQRFFKLDNSIIEVVAGPHTRGRGAELWGLVVSIDDLFELVEAVGPDVMSPPRRAVQPGRFISTVRASVGLGVPFAMMTPHYSSSSPVN